MSVCSGRADKPRAGLSPGMRAAGMGSRRLALAGHPDAAQTDLLGVAPAPEWGQLANPRHCGTINRVWCRTFWSEPPIESGREQSGQGQPAVDRRSSNPQASKQTALQCAARLLGTSSFWKQQVRHRATSPGRLVTVRLTYLIPQVRRASPI